MKRKQYPNQNKTEPSGGDKASFRLGYHFSQKEQMLVINLAKIRTKAVASTVKAANHPRDYLALHFCYEKQNKQNHIIQLNLGKK